MTWQQNIQEGLDKMSLTFSSKQVDQLNQTITQLVKWNRAYNLTAIREPEQMIIRHLFDSLVTVPLLKPGRLLDVGTGAGFPGVPLAIAEPEQEYFLLDSNGKKTRYLKQLVYEMGLKQITVLDTRVEQWQPDRPFDVIISRAFASLEKMILLSEHLLSAKGVWQAMKGEYPELECEQLPDWVAVESIDKLQVPGLQAERHLVTICRK